jgi:hypothetical protein
MADALSKAIGVGKLTEYFKYLDDLRESGVTNMFGAQPYLMRRFPGMVKQEASKVHMAWMETFDDALPVEDRADKALED